MKWKYVEPGPNGEVVEVIMSDDEILAIYYPWWQEQMTKVGKTELISPQHCIDDWITVHWASKVEGTP